MTRTTSTTALMETGPWHRPLLVLAAAMVALAVFCVIAIVVDPTRILGVDRWEKPLKFAISTAIYSVTWSWLIGRFRRGVTWAKRAGTVGVILLAIELVIIVGAAAADTTSHFTVSTPLSATLWGVMAVSISLLWAVTLGFSILLFRNPLGDRAQSLAIRAGAMVALIGMALGFLMTGPAGDQIENYRGIIGAHTVGVADGGPGLPLLGWSTVAGDLRIPHFVGMHALQVIPIVAILLGLLSRRVPRLRNVNVRFRLVLVAAATYLATIGALTWQALRGQSIVQPDAATLATAVVVAVAAAIGVTVTCSAQNVLGSESVESERAENGDLAKLQQAVVGERALL